MVFSELYDEGRRGWTGKCEHSSMGSQKGCRTAPGGHCNRQRDLLDVLAGLAATFVFSAIQQIVSPLDKMEVCFLCHLPGHLLSKPALSSQQEAWLPLTSAGLFLAFLCPLHFLARSWYGQAAG